MSGSCTVSIELDFRSFNMDPLAKCRDNSCKYPDRGRYGERHGTWDCHHDKIQKAIWIAADDAKQMPHTPVTIAPGTAPASILSLSADAARRLLTDREVRLVGPSPYLKDWYERVRAIQGNPVPVLDEWGDPL